VTAEPGWLDVSLPIGPDTPVYPGDPAIEVSAVSTLDHGPSHVSRLVCGSHTGTHVDAPAHFIRGGTPLGSVPLSRWSGPCWVIEVPAAEEIRPDHWLAALPEAPVERVLFKTPNSQLWDTPQAGHVWQALSLEGAEWLVAHGVKLVGIDALSIERGGSEDFPVHHTLLGNDVLLLEGLDLRAVSPGPYDLLCLPLRLEVPDGAPARAVLRPLT
jgi:arylformamidase